MIYEEAELTQINLLPWREEHLSYDNRKFGVVAGGVFIVGILISFLFSMGVGMYNSSVRSDIKYLNKEIKGLKAQIGEIEGLKDQKENLLKKMRVIHELQSDRLNIVKLFNSLAVAVPSNIHLQEIVRKSDEIEIKGISDSNNAISSFMRNLEKHNILTNTDLNKIQLNSKGGFDFFMDTRWKEK